MLKIEEAKKELATKSLNDIQIETAWKWASMAAASYQNSLEVKGKDRLLYWSLGEEYAHEAMEHAGLVSSSLLTEVREALSSYVEEATDAISGRLASKDDTVENQKE